MGTWCNKFNKFGPRLLTEVAHVIHLATNDAASHQQLILHGRMHIVYIEDLLTWCCCCIKMPHCTSLSAGVPEKLTFACCIHLDVLAKQAFIGFSKRCGQTTPHWDGVTFDFRPSYVAMRVWVPG